LVYLVQVLPEVLKMKDTTRGQITRFKRGLLTKVLFLGLIAIISLAMVYKSRASIQATNTDDSAPAGHSAGDLKEATRQAVLDWMGENSAMSETVLSHIYGIAAGTVNSDLVLAVCLVESNFNPRAESDKGAVGLMGIMPAIWLDELKAQGIVRKKEDLYKIADNMAAGTYVLESYLSKTGNIRQALIRYEGGDSWYATRVLKTMRKISLVRHSQENVYLASARD
jgi:soluble lytic murein transglycosylase-like protein